MLEDIIIRLDDNFSEYLSDIRENEDKRIENELARIENEKIRNEFFAQLLADKKMYYKRFKKVYGTVTENDDTFEMPSEYTSLCMLDVYVNGFYLNPNEYRIEDKNIVLTKSLDKIGTIVEIVVTKAIGITTEDYEDLKGYSAYEVAVKNGFEGSVEEWLKSLSGDGGYKKTTKYYTTTTKNEKRFKLPYAYDTNCDLDVFVNGFKLNGSEFSVQKDNGGFEVILVKPLDVIGTVVELAVIDANTVNIATIDRELNEESANPIQNKAVAVFSKEVNAKVETNTTNITKNKTDIVVQGTKIEALETDNETNKTDIGKLKEDVTALEKDKADKTELPTKVGELENDNNFIDNAVDDLVNYYKKSDTYSKQEVNTIVGNISTLKILVVESLPTSDIDTSTIYFKAKENSDEDNIYDEFIRVSNKWEKIGDTKVDLSNYVTIEMLNQAIANFLTSEQINTLVQNALANYYTKEQMDALLGEKASVDFVNGVKEEMHERLADVEEKVKISTDTVIAGKHVYGIRRKLTDNSSPEWERIDDSIGLVASAKKETLDYMRNDFDNIYPWRSD